MTLRIVPITLRDAQAYVEQHHRHHGPPRGHLWSIGATDDSGQLVGVAIVGRPVARNPHPLARPRQPPAGRPVRRLARPLGVARRPTHGGDMSAEIASYPPKPGHLIWYDVHTRYRLET